MNTTTLAIDTKLPVFVYGTLREGCWNHERLSDFRAQGRAAVLDGYAMYDSGVPFIRENAEAHVIGEVYVIEPDVYDEAMRGLDRLEGFRPDDPEGGGYIRTAVTVIADGEPVQAWAYVGGKWFRENEDARVVSGDWAAHCAH